MYQVTINDGEPIAFEEKNGALSLSSESEVVDLIQISKNEYHALVNGKSARISIKKINKAEKTMTATVNGKACTISITDKMDSLLKNMGLENVLVKKMNELKAPMPGLVLEVLVKRGDSVVKGDPLLVLEAMKMENIIKSAGDGVVKDIKVNTKDAVDKNQVLITFG